MNEHQPHIRMSGVGKIIAAAVSFMALAPSLALAQAIDNPAFVTYSDVTMANVTASPANSTVPPAGFSDSKDSGISVTYSLASGTPDGTYLNVTVQNTNTNANGTADYTLFSNSSYNVSKGNVIRSIMDLAVNDPKSVAFVNSGFGLSADTSANGQFASETSIADSGAGPIFQNLTAEVVGGSKSWGLGTGHATNNVQPTLVVYNIPAGETIGLRIKSWELESGLATANYGSNAILPMQTAHDAQYNPHRVKSGNTIKITVPLIGKSFSGTYKSELLIKNVVGVVIRTYVNNPAKWSASQGKFTDTFTIDLNGQPLSVAGNYTVAYRLIPQGQTGGMRLNLASSQTNLAEKGIASNYHYNIGTLAVTSAGGSHVGMSVHYQPATIEPATYKFYRTLADDDLWQPWWDADDDGNFVAPGTVSAPTGRWGHLDSWAARYAPNPGDRKLLITFFGSPTNAASNEHATSDLWGGPAGMISPPANADTFKLAVKATLTRSSVAGRIFAVECWNEPNQPGMYEGTRTQLADTCKVLYEAVQEVNATLTASQKIPVICPQADSPYSIGFVYGAKTSETPPKPIGNYCDWVGSHLYSGLSTDSDGKPYSEQSLADNLRLIKERGRQYNLQNKEIAVTEFGVHRCLTKPSMAYERLVKPGALPATLDDLTDLEKGEALTSALLTMQEEGIHAVGLYSHDEGVGDYKCRRNGSYVWTKTGGEGGQAQTDNTAVQTALGAAISVMGSTAVPVP